MDEERIVAAAEQAARHGGPVAAVLPMRTTAGAVRFACALQRRARRSPGSCWTRRASRSTPAEIRSVAETIAICETAEESGAMLAAAVEADACCSARSAWWRTTTRRRGRAARDARGDRAVAAAEDGVRVAEPGYLDRVAVTAAMVGDRFDYLKDIAYGVSAKLSGAPGESGEALAESLWAAVRILARDGAPDRFREAVEGGMAAAQAFAGDCSTTT